MRGGIAERGGVRVGHRIIEINGQSVVAVPHERIVNLLATSVGEVNYAFITTTETMYSVSTKCDNDDLILIYCILLRQITMRTMPTSMFRLLTGQETPMYI